MKPRKANSPSKATQYRGDGKVFAMFGGCMFERSLTDEEKKIVKKMHDDYEHYLGDFYVTAGTNMGKQYWILQTEDGYDLDSYKSMKDLANTLDNWINKQIQLGIMR